MLQAERIAECLQSRLPQASDIAVQNVFRIPGGASRETWSFDARWREGGWMLEPVAIGLHAPRRLSGPADSVGTN